MSVPDTRRLLSGENPPSPSTQMLADTLASWTDTRSLPLPVGPASLAATTAENAAASTAYSPAAHGALWQRFVNTFALELDTIHRALDDALYDGFLEYPGKNRTSLDRTWKVALPSASTVVVSVAANDSPIYLSSGVNPDGSSILDPARGAGVNLLPVARLFDFYYGLAQEVTLIVAGLTSYPLPSRVGTNIDGSLQVEWVTVNGVPNSTWSIGADRRSISFTPQLISGSTIVVHYTTYDVYYVVEDALPALFLRSPYFELFLTTSGTPPTSNGTTTVAANVSIVTPQLDMMWNELDEIGLYLGKSRQPGELNATFAQRLVDSILYPQSSTPTGLRNALATELSLVSHLSWGPGGAATASTVSLGSQVYEDSILVDRLPLPYYSVKTTSNQTGTLALSVPALAVGAKQTFTVQLLATGGAVVPGTVPLSLSATLPDGQSAIYDQLGNTDPNGPGAFHRPTSLLSAPSRPWYRGSLRVWKNGTALVPGTDFLERSSTSFSLAAPAQPGDVLLLGYIYDASEGVPAIVGQADLDTDLTPVVRISAGYAVDPVLSGASKFPGWSSLPPNTDLASVPTNGSWTLTLEVTNAGSSTSSSFTLSVKLPPTITFDGTFIHSSDVSVLRAVSYIDGAVVWVRNLTDPALRATLYDSAGRATPLLKAFAAEIASASPLEWGQVRWDRTIWHTFNERYEEFGFIPHLLDPDYKSQLTARQIRYAGQLTGKQGQFGTEYIDFTKPGTALGVSSALRYPDFVSGIGDRDDCKLSIATPDQITASNSRVPLQNVLRGTSVTPVFAIPAEQRGAWWAGITPGAYFLNQEAHAFFAQPLYAEMSGTNLLLPGTDPNGVVVAALYDPQAGLVPLRQVNFSDAAGNASLFTTQTLVGTGASSYELNYPDFWSAATVGPGSDGLTYTVSTTFTNPIPAGTPAIVQSNLTQTSTASFVLNGVLQHPPKMGNVMAAFTATDGFMATAPPGWTELAINPQPNDLRVFVKQVTASDGTSYNFLSRAAQASWGIVGMVELSGVGDIASIVVSNNVYVSGSTSPLSMSSSLAIPAVGGMLLAAYSAAVFGGGTVSMAQTPPAGQTMATVFSAREPIEENLLVKVATSEPHATGTWTDTASLTWSSHLYSTFGGALVWFPPAPAGTQNLTLGGTAPNNVITVSPPLPAGVSLEVSYALNRSFTVVEAPTGAMVYADRAQPGGILVTYEGGGDVNVTDLPLHPYYNPRSSGFVYLSPDFYLPTQLAVRVDPYAVPADGKTTYTVRAVVGDAYGSGTDGLPVSVLVNYREGALSFNGTTDVFGAVTIDVPAASSTQVAMVTATMQLSDSKGHPVSALLDHTFVEMFSSYA